MCQALIPLRKKALLVLDQLMMLLHENDRSHHATLARGRSWIEARRSLPRDGRRATGLVRGRSLGAHLLSQTRAGERCPHQCQETGPRAGIAGARDHNRQASQR